MIVSFVSVSIIANIIRDAVAHNFDFDISTANNTGSKNNLNFKKKKKTKGEKKKEEVKLTDIFSSVWINIISIVIASALVFVQYVYSIIMNLPVTIFGDTPVLNAAEYPLIIHELIIVVIALITYSSLMSLLVLGVAYSIRLHKCKKRGGTDVLKSLKEQINEKSKENKILPIRKLSENWNKYSYANKTIISLIYSVLLLNFALTMNVINYFSDQSFGISDPKVLFALGTPLLDSFLIFLIYFIPLGRLLNKKFINEAKEARKTALNFLDGKIRKVKIIKSFDEMDSEQVSNFGYYENLKSLRKQIETIEDNENLLKFLISLIISLFTAAVSIYTSVIAGLI